MNDFTQQINRGLWRNFGKIFFGRISQVNRPFNAVTKAEFLCEFYRQVARGKHTAATANLFDNFAAIMRQNLRLHLFHDIRPAKIDFLGTTRDFRFNGIFRRHILKLRLNHRRVELKS